MRTSRTARRAGQTEKETGTIEQTARVECGSSSRCSREGAQRWSASRLQACRHRLNFNSQQQPWNRLSPSLLLPRAALSWPGGRGARDLGHHLQQATRQWQGQCRSPGQCMPQDGLPQLAQHTRQFGPSLLFVPCSLHTSMCCLPPSTARSNMHAPCAGACRTGT